MHSTVDLWRRNPFVRKAADAYMASKVQSANYNIEFTTEEQAWSDVRSELSATHFYGLPRSLLQQSIGVHVRTQTAFVTLRLLGPNSWDEARARKNLVSAAAKTDELLGMLKGIGATTFPTQVVVVALDASRCAPTTMGAALKPVHVNGGVTIMEHGRSSVYVYRTEDMYKVLLHELIHACGFGMADHHALDEKLARKLGVQDSSGRVSLDEAFTETLTITLLCVILAVDKTLARPVDNTVRLYDTTFWNDLVHCAATTHHHILSTCNSILRQQGLRRLPDPSGKKLQQESNVASYYFVRAALLHPRGGLRHWLRFLANEPVTMISDRTLYDVVLICMANNHFWSAIATAVPPKQSGCVTLRMTPMTQ